MKFPIFGKTFCEVAQVDAILGRKAEDISSTDGELKMAFLPPTGYNGPPHLRFIRWACRHTSNLFSS